jgi:peroxiredoxin
MNKRIFIILILFIVAMVVYYGYFMHIREAVREGDLAPDFALPQRNGTVIRLSELRGQTVLLNFWATWCPPCLLEMPSLDRLHKNLSQANFTVIAISIDEGGWPLIDEFLKRVPLSFPILLDYNTDVAASYGTFQLPESYLIGPDGTVIKKYHGPREWDQKTVVEEIKALMAGN